MSCVCRLLQMARGKDAAFAARAWSVAGRALRDPHPRLGVRFIYHLVRADRGIEWPTEVKILRLNVLVLTHQRIKDLTGIDVYKEQHAPDLSLRVGQFLWPAAHVCGRCQADVKGGPS